MLYSTFRLQVEDVVRETEDTITICFKQPGLKKIKYQSGQYLTVVLNINGRKYKRPYSISSTFGVDKTLNITIKRVVNGVVSNYINDNIIAGSFLEVIQPMGTFYLDLEDAFDGTIFLWGAGSGITPLFSIIKTILFQRKIKNRIVVIYSNPIEKNVIFKQALEKVQEEYSTQMNVIFYYTRENANSIFGKVGRIKHTDVEDLLKMNGENVQSRHYICGPEEMKTMIVGVLKENNIQKENIFTEDYEHHVKASDLTNVVDSTILISTREFDSNFHVKRGNNVLEAALNVSLDLPYSCQTGNCNLCKAKLIKGSVKMLGAENVADLEPDDFLLCCTYPLSTQVEFKID